MKRLWWYGYGDWLPRRWNWVLPHLGADEYGRRTLVQHVPPFGFLVWAFWTCRCEDCDEVRAETAEWDRTTAEVGPRREED